MLYVERNAGYSLFYPSSWKRRECRLVVPLLYSTVQYSPEDGCVGRRLKHGGYHKELGGGSKDASIEPTYAEPSSRGRNGQPRGTR